MTKKKFRAGVVGLGMGVNHCNGYRSHPDVELVAVADIDPERLEERGRKTLQVPHCYSTAEEMFEKEKLDIVSVAVPNVHHNDLTLKALRAGANVLCEKPMAMDEKQAQEMLDTAKKLRKKLGINFSYRFSPQARAMKDIVDNGGMGEIYFAQSNWYRRRGIPGLGMGSFNSPGAAGRWFFDKAMSGGGPLIDLGVHRLDFCLWMMGYPEPEWVLGTTYDKLGPDIAKKTGDNYTVEDLAGAMIKFKNGASVQLVASWATNVRENEIMNSRLVGTKGGLFQFNLNEDYQFDMQYSYELNGIQYDATPHAPFRNIQSSYYLFADAVVNDKPFLVKPEEGVTVMKILDAVYKSAKTGKPVNIG